jgi:hypothetical protein
MKYIRFLLVLVIALAGLGLAQSPAKAGAFTYNSGISLQNLASVVANITLHFYLPNGTEDPGSPIAATIPANGSVVYYPIPTADGFSGSVVVESDAQIASISNILGNGGAAAAAYDGSSEGGLNVLLPLLMSHNGNYNTWFNVQNAGSADANVSITYSDGVTASATVKPGAAATFDQSTENHGTTKVFSGVVTSNQPVAATVIEEDTRTMFAYSGFNSGSTAPVLPLINTNNSGYITGINVQNSGSSDTNVTISYTPSAAGTACTETQTVLAGKSATFALFPFSGTAFSGTSTCIAHEKFIGSAKVTGNTTSQALTAVVNQLKPGVNGEAYGGFDPSAATGSVVLPLIMNANSTYWTSISIMNVGAAATNVTCTFTPYGSVVLPTPTAHLDPNQGVSFLQAAADEFGATKYIGSATCTTSPAGQIVAVVNELGGSPTADQLLVYEGFNTTP